MPWIPLRYFTADEFNSPDDGTSGENMDSTFALKLDQLRHMCGFPFKITSGYRTAVHNRKVGGAGSSAHTEGLAVDIQARTSGEKFRIVANALLLGFNRVGVYSGHIHIDDSKTLPQNVLWTGKE